MGWHDNSEFCMTTSRALACLFEAGAAPAELACERILGLGLDVRKLRKLMVETPLLQWLQPDQLLGFAANLFKLLLARHSLTTCKACTFPLMLVDTRLIK